MWLVLFHECVRDSKDFSNLEGGVKTQEAK